MRTAAPRVAPPNEKGLPAFRSWALAEFASCNGGDEFAKIWVVVVELGDSLADGGTKGGFQVAYNC